jgi:hypothetical protein
MVKIYPSLIGRMSVLRGELLRFEWRRSPTWMESTGKYIQQWTTNKLRLSSLAVGGQLSAHSINSSVVQNVTQGPKSWDSLKDLKKGWKTNAMEQSSLWEANRHSEVQKFSNLLRNSKVYDSAPRKTPRLMPTLSGRKPGPAVRL